jgi:integrase
MSRVRLKGIRKVRSRLADRSYHYSRATGKCFWNSDNGVLEGSPGYLAAYEAAHDIQPGAERPREASPAGGLVLKTILRDFYASKVWTEKLAAATKRQYGRGLKDVEARWGSAPKAAIEAASFRHSVLKWAEENWSGKEVDHRLTPLKRVLNWAVDDRKLLAINNLARIPLYYEGSDRAEIIWLDDEVDEVCATAYHELARAVRLMAETALRPGDLVRLNRNHIRATPEGGRAILIRTNKSGRSTAVQIPVTPGAAAIIDATPPDQLLILKPRETPHWTVTYLSQEVADQLNALKLKRGRAERLREIEAVENAELRLYDLRGTACTRLVNAGLSIGDLALHMGWKPSYAAKMLDVYTAMNTGRADAMLRRLHPAKPAIHSPKKGEA